MNRLLLYVHYNKFNKLDDHVLYQLESVKNLYSKIVVVSNSQLVERDKSKLEKVANVVIQRDNIGFDFAAWRDAFDNEGFENISGYDSVTLMNDTCFGPMYDMSEVYTAMNKNGYDFWGMTSHGKSEAGMPKTNGPVPEHLQSYFVVFDKKVTASSVFIDFWKSVRDFSIVEDVIINYETKLTGVLTQAGFKRGVYFDSVKYRTENNIVGRHNFSELEPYVLFDHKVPFIKVKSIMNYNEQTNKLFFDRIENTTKYPVDLIVKFLSKFSSFDRIDIFSRKMIVNNLKLSGGSSIAIHIHVFYVDILEGYLNILEKATFKFDLYATTTLGENEDKINTLAKKYKNIESCEVIVGDNLGRDVVPWLRLFGKLKSYDIAAHFHTKKSRDSSNELIGGSWRRDLENMLMKKADDIIANLESNKNLGIVIADIPEVFHYLGGMIYYNELSIRKHLKELCSRMSTPDMYEEFFAFKDHKMTFIASYGTMLWYKPKALQKLDDIKLTDSEIPKEPLEESSTILHAVERLPVYVAHKAGYDFAISPLREGAISGFVDNFAYNKAVVAGLSYSRVYRFGKRILSPVFVLRKIVNRIKGRK